VWFLQCGEETQLGTMLSVFTRFMLLENDYYLGHIFLVDIFTMGIFSVAVFPWAFLLWTLFPKSEHTV